MRVGFTGSRKGTKAVQRETLRRVLGEIGVTEFHHGDCVGADADAHAIAQALGLTIVIHPPSDERHRAFCGDAQLLPALPFLARNQNIVATTEMLVAAPDGAERARSGTWATIRAAIRAQKRVIIVMPSGARVENAADDGAEMAGVGNGN